MGLAIWIDTPNIGYAILTRPPNKPMHLTGGIGAIFCVGKRRNAFPIYQRWYRAGS